MLTIPQMGRMVSLDTKVAVDKGIKNVLLEIKKRNACLLHARCYSP